MRARPILLACAGIALTALLAACGGDHTAGGSHSGSDSSSQAAVTGQAGDIAFAQLMIPHHEQAIEMADIALQPQANASAEVVGLAEQIKSAQDPEIAQMTAWLQEWGAPTQMPGVTGDPADADHGGHDMGGMSMSGMMTAEDMTALEQARGRDFDRMWLQMMIAHHQGAIDMARQVQMTTADTEVRALSDAVIAGQTAEIETMKKLLDA